MASDDTLAARKQLLVARARLHRLQLRHQAQGLRRSLVTPATALSFVTSAPMRPLIVSALLMVVGRGRLSKVLRGALAALAIAKALRAR